MNNPGKLTGQKVRELFNLLVDNKIIISMAVMGEEFERLTCVTDVVTTNNIHHFIVDLPRGFKSVARYAKPLKLLFNFNGPDKLEYIFNTVGGTYKGNCLVLQLPEYVDRLQRRKDFRVGTPIGMKIVFESGKIKAVLEAINISLGGVYGMMEAHTLENAKGPVLKTGKNIYNIGLIFPGDKEMGKRVVVIEKADVRRIEHDKDRQIYKYAFKFLHIDKDQYKKLTEIIYHIQRQQLRPW